jgi:D-hydantoinase
MATVDLLIKNGKLVIPKVGILEATLAVDEGRVVSISKHPTQPQADKLIDAKGKYVLPGVIDPHTHYGDYYALPWKGYSWEDDFRTETQSAAIGGCTSLIDYLHTKPGYETKSYFGYINDDIASAEKNSLLDFALHIVILSEKHTEDIPDYAKRAGITSFKFLLGYKGAGAAAMGLPSFDDGLLYLGFKKMSSVGSPAIGLVHAENAEVSNRLRERLMKEGKTGLQAWEESRPAFTEVEAISRSVIIARAAGCPLYIVHISAAEGVDVVTQAKSEGLEVWAETTPAYLSFTKDDEFPNFTGKFQPPLRDRNNRERLWQELKEGKIDTIGGEHCACRLAEIEKKDYWFAPLCAGAGSEIILPVLLSEGVNKRGVTLERVAEVTSYNVARAFGLYPQKGTITVGSDADLTIVDLDKKVVATPEILKRKTNFILHDRWEFKGWPTMTIVRGNVVAEDNEIVGKSGTGRYIKRAPKRGQSN